MKLESETVKEIVKKCLNENKYDGLCCIEGDYCECGVDDLMNCGMEGIESCFAIKTFRG